MEDLALLADLIKAKNSVDNIIANLIGRPAQVGHVGEYIAAHVFGIELNISASHKCNDGYFTTEPLAGGTVNIKWYLKREGLLDLKPNMSCDYYLVLTGPGSAAASSRGASRPWIIESVYLFDVQKLIDTLNMRGSKIGIATSVIGRLWDEAEIYPVQRNNQLLLTDEQCRQLALFRLGV